MGWIKVAGRTSDGLAMWVLDLDDYAAESEPAEHIEPEPTPLDLETEYNWDLNSDD